MKPESEQQAGMDWEAVTWEGSRRSQLDYWAQMSLDEIFAAQEEMAEFGRLIAEAPARPPDASARTPGEERDG